MVWNCTHSGYKWKHYMLVSERYMWADGRVVINNNSPDLINSAGILAIHFLWWGYVYKFEISCKKQGYLIMIKTSRYPYIIRCHNRQTERACFPTMLCSVSIFFVSCFSAVSCSCGGAVQRQKSFLLYAIIL